MAAEYSQTEAILENGRITDMRADDVQKILNLKHAWKFILDPDVISYPSDCSLLCQIAKIVNEGFTEHGGRIRGVTVLIRGTSYVPPLPAEQSVKERIDDILRLPAEPIGIAIQLCLYCLKTQIFRDGNKRAAVLFANHFLISAGSGLLIISGESVPEFRRLLVAYYEDRDGGELTAFLRRNAGRPSDPYTGRNPGPGSPGRLSSPPASGVFPTGNGTFLLPTPRLRVQEPRLIGTPAAPSVIPHSGTGTSRVRLPSPGRILFSVKPAPCERSPKLPYKFIAIPGMQCYTVVSKAGEPKTPGKEMPP